MDPLTDAALAAASFVNTAFPDRAWPYLLQQRALRLKAGALATAGVAVANLTLIGATFAILLGLLSLSSTAFAMMKWIGIGLLVWFVCRIFAASSEASPAAGSEASGTFRRDRRIFRRPLQPLQSAFYLALLPPLMPAEALKPAAMATATMALLVGCVSALASVICSRSHPGSS